MKQYKYLIVIIFFCSTSFAAEHPADIVDNFMRDSVQYRLSYFYQNRFCNDSDKEQLRILSEKASKELAALESACRLEKKRIEEYSGDDWDIKFGVTGLWRQTVSDLNNAVQLKDKIDYFVDLSGGGKSLKNQKNRAATVMERSKNEEISAATDVNSFERNVQQAFVRLRAGDDSKLRTVIERWSETRPFFARMILGCLESSGDVESLTLLETQLAAEAAIASDCGRYKTILAKLAESSFFAEPIILYAAGTGHIESDPNRAIEYFVKASHFNSEFTLISAEQAARVAYQLHNGSKEDCQFAIGVFRNYMLIAASRADETLEYCYSRLLGQCGETQGATEVLQKIAGRDKGQFAHQAEFELLSDNLTKNKASKLRQLIDKISKSEPVDKELRDNVVMAYCREQSESAELSDALDTVEVLAKIGQADCRIGDYVLSLISKITERIDEYQIGMPNSVIQNCYDITVDYIDCFEGQQKAAAELFCTELGIVAGKGTEVQQFLEGLREVVDNNCVDVLRCKARLLMAQGRYQSAGLLWAQIAGSEKPLAEEDPLINWCWWRAKYYELTCALKMKQVDIGRIRHSAEVLLHSADNIPVFWKAKLTEISAEKL